MYNRMWTKQEIDYLTKCYKENYDPASAFAQFVGKYDGRTRFSAESKIRNMGYSIYDLLKLKPADISVREKTINEKYKSKIKQLEVEVDMLRQEKKNNEAIEELIHGVAGHDFTKIPRWISESKERGITGIPMLCLSDWHRDEVVDPAQINYVNEFNRKICSERMEFTFKTCVALCLDFFKKPRFEGIVVGMNGDMLSGNIHDELSETNESFVLQAIIEMVEDLTSGIRLLADKFGKVFVPCTVGNHGRYHKKPRAKSLVRHNYEWLVYQWLYRNFKDDPRVNIVIPDNSDILYQIYGIKILQTHGNQFSGGAGISGIQTPLALGQARKQRKQQAIKMPFDIMYLGHFHQYIHTQTLIVNGSGKGYDEWANQQNYPFERPQQALFIVHKDHGITYRMPILCDAYEKKSLPEDSKIPIWQKSPS
jgi:hypothetical protein